MLQAHASATIKMPTPVLTRLLHEAAEHQARAARALPPQDALCPPGRHEPALVVIHGNSLEHVTDSYKRYLEGRLREHFKLVGTPMRIEMRSAQQPLRRRAMRPCPVSHVSGRAPCDKVGAFPFQHGAYREQQRPTLAGPLS
jgi:GTP-binding protein